ncbi:hypothetical protein PENSTE_c009G09582 [Penicillium steckii]|uniref:AB hydrolase-1 domain-containing protein n=1 Tax=Penicillium steckii TaxID=303698 RepID=A0A1V6T9J2_9EURO|nr:hypothetical protein PENSTE_c009G09582 [Penicillium steckii]
MAPTRYPVDLMQTFHHSTSTHVYQIRWTSLGDPELPPLIFVHGTPWSSQVWAPYAKSLSKHFHVYLFDNPGFGDSPLGRPLREIKDPLKDKVELDANLARQSEVFAALYEYWAPTWCQKPHVIAHDHGGLMSLRAHFIHGCEFASLCLINVVAIGPFGQPLFKLIAENAAVFTEMNGFVFEGVVESYIREAAHNDLGKDVMEILKTPWVSTEEGRKGFIRQMVQANYRSTEDVEYRYSEVGRNMSVHIIWGKKDRWIPVETAARLKEKLGASSVSLVEDAGHLVMYDQEGQLGVELGWWLARV